MAAAATAVKEVAPGAEVVGPASKNIDTPFLVELFELGALEHYTQIWPPPYRSDGPETAAVDLASLRALVGNA